MAVSDIIKIRIIGLKKDKKNILDLLEKKGVLEIIDTEDIKEPIVREENTDYELANVKFALDFLARFSSEKVSLRDKISGVKVSIKEGVFSAFTDSYPYMEIASKAQDIEKRLNESLSIIDQLQNEINLLNPWRKLNNNPLVHETTTTKIFFGIISEKKYVNLVQVLNKFPLSHIRTIDRIEKNLYLEIIFDKNNREIETIIDQIGLVKKDLPHPGSSPREAVAELSSKLKDEEKVIEDLKNGGRELAKEINDLRLVFDILSSKKNREDAVKMTYETGETFIITGWVEDRFLSQLINEIKDISNYTSIESLKIEENESRPVVINNSSFWSPFESVTGIYGLPQHHEIDPTPILAPFFIVFFAFCLTDAGYGIILMALSFIAIRILKVPKSAHNLFRLLGYGGLITFIMGALFGGWLGIDVNTLPAPIANLQLINPVENPLLVLMISLVLGVIQVIFGLMVAFYWKAKKGMLKEAIFDNGVWIFFLSAISLFIASSSGLVPDNYANLVRMILWLGVAGVIIAGGRNQANPFLKIISGVGSLYGLIGYLSDVLSYSRLLALGLATGIIAMVVNMIAALAGELIPYIGPIVAIIVLIGGHTFNIGINTLGAFIHSGRLQFVEFFPKFMDGGGRKFNPLRRDLKYVDVVDG